MPELKFAQTVDQIVDVMAGSLAVRVKSPGEDLLETGILDSLALVRLTTLLGERFGLDPARLLLDTDSFRSVETIARLVMRSQPADGPVDEVRSVLLERLAVRVDSPDTDLFATGALDSMALVRFVMALEDRFGVQIPFDEIDIASFRSVADVSRMLAGQMGQDGSAAAGGRV